MPVCRRAVDRICRLDECRERILVHNLVANKPGIADHTDPNLVNPWGNGFTSGSPFWIGNNGSGTSMLYDGTGTATALVVQMMRI